MPCLTVDLCRREKDRQIQKGFIRFEHVQYYQAFFGFPELAQDLIQELPMSSSEDFIFYPEISDLPYCQPK